MITLAWYLLKVIICSGILCGYYFLALRNKVFHRWNRFYLLASVVISLTVPVMKINIFQNNEDKGAVVQMLQTISYGDEAVIEYSRNSGFQINTENLAESVYLLVSIIFLIIFFVSLYKIKKLRKKYPETKIEDISFISTNAKGTPFSFFKSIFWNNAIDLHSKPGQQIFNHEIAHVKEKHSYDKIFLNIVLIFFWINPFFWLMRKELYMIHEFIADKEALEDNDINAFAEMILQTVYPGRNFSISNSFFYSPLKRRIMMLTKNKNPKVNYYSRLLVLPLAAIVFFAFTLKVNSTNSLNSYNGKTMTVVIDAGHGGNDNGAVSADGVKEKNITLQIAKKIKALNTNPKINILLSRNNDQNISVKERVEFAKNNNADLFISIHLNSAVNEQLNGFSVLIDKNNKERNQLLGSALINELKKSYQTSEKIGERGNGIWVLDHNVCPASLVQCGFISNPNDLAFIADRHDQEKIAKNILDAINVYASVEEKQTDKSTAFIDDAESGVIKDTIPSKNDDKKVKGVTFNDSKNEVHVEYVDGSKETITEEEALQKGIVLPPPQNALIIIDGKKSSKDQMKNIPSENIESINVLKGKKAIEKYGEKGKNGAIEIITKDQNESTFRMYADTVHVNNFSSKSSDNIKATGKKAAFIDSKIPSNALIFIDGKESSEKELRSISPAAIESITILKDRSGILKYGNKAKDGVIEIITKKKSMSSPTDTIPDKIFTKTEAPASFPGGQQAWISYIVKQIKASIDSFTQADYGTCVVRFIVDVDGRVSDVQATTMQGTLLAKVSVEAIKNGPKWIPAKQNGHDVAAYRLQPVTLKQPNNEMKPSSKTESNAGKVFIKAEQPASFPGGQSAWLKYISGVIDKHGNELTADKNNSGACKVRFIVDINGQVSDVRATTKQGTELAEVAVNAIKEGPEWIPGKQNGHVVNSYVIQSVGFSLNDELMPKGGSLKVTH